MLRQIASYVSDFFELAKTKKFIVSCLLTVGILISVMGIGVGVYALYQTLTRPPVVPTHEYVHVFPVFVETEPPSENHTITPYENGEDVIEATPITVRMERKPYFYTFVIFALDSGNNVDALMVVSFDAVSGEANLISIPRDTRLDIEPRRPFLRKPVSGYAVGRSAGRAEGRAHESGVAQVKDDVQTLFGFRPDFYISIRFRAFERMVNTVGGVRVHVPFHMRYDDPYQSLHINIPAGTQTLNGQQALHFARFRYANEGYRAATDYQRMANQQQIIRALFNELLTPRTLLRLPELISNYNENVDNNMSLQEMLWFAAQIADLGSAANISTYTIPTLGTTGRPGWYELPDPEGILELVNRTVNPFTTDITSEMVMIFNE